MSYRYAINVQEDPDLARACGAGDLVATQIIVDNAERMPESFRAAAAAAAAAGHTKVIREMLAKAAPSLWWSDSRALREAAAAGHRQIVELLLQVSDPNAGSPTALEYAAQAGHADVVEMLIPVTDAKMDRSSALQRAAAYGHTEIIKMLIPVSDPKADQNRALRDSVLLGNTEAVRLLTAAGCTDRLWALPKAVERGHVEIAKILLPTSNPKWNDSEALRTAAERGNLELVDLLIPASEPKALQSNALCVAAEKGHADVVRALLPVSNPHDNNDAAIKHAAGNGHTAVVRILLDEVFIPERATASKSALSRIMGAIGRDEPRRPKADPLAEAILTAAQNGHLEVVDLILPVADGPDALSTVVIKHVVGIGKPISPAIFAHIKAHFDEKELRSAHVRAPQPSEISPCPPGHDDSAAPEDDRRPRM